MALKSNQQTTIATEGGIDTDDTEFTLTTGAFDTKTSGDKVPIVIDPDSTAKLEVLKCYINGTAVSSCTRAQDGTSAVAHSQGAIVTLGSTPSAWDYYLDNDYAGALKDGTGWDVNIGARAYASAAQDNITHDVATKVVLGSEDYDLGNNFASNKFTAPVAGTYLITGQITLSTVEADTNNWAYIYKNGAAVAQYKAHSSNTSHVSTAVTTPLRLAASDYIELYVMQAGAADNTDIVTGTENTFLAVQLLST